ncbi:hypothetical protein A0J61_01112 [Choanephora cucurbitarum]|uniref:Uncharacterized protein n=1 Tax=Choanephora cucurbitarum TaxID=101091 RepID=A0A1C7NP90_9FUNG|nr:hypothetical protein A0J61_01112 [Choanephora cucurbitarum]
MICHSKGFSIFSGALRLHDMGYDNTQRCLYMLNDCHQLLLNLSSQMNDMRIKLDYQTVNSTFYSTNSSSSNNYTIFPTELYAS